MFGLAVNPEEDKLYISDYRGRKIVVTSLDGSGGRTLINCSSHPEGLALDLNKRCHFKAMVQFSCTKCSGFV